MVEEKLKTEPNKEEKKEKVEEKVAEAKDEKKEPKKPEEKAKAEKQKTEKNKEEPKSIKEYIIPLRAKWNKVPRYKRANKAIKAIKEFLLRHLKIRDKDLSKIKIDKYLNEFVWFRGIRKPPAKVRVNVTVESNGTFKVELAELPEKLKYKKAREERLEKAAEEVKKKKKEKVEEKKGKTEEAEKAEEKEKVEEKEKAKAVETETAKLEKAAAKKNKA